MPPAGAQQTASAPAGRLQGHATGAACPAQRLSGLRSALQLGGRATARSPVLAGTTTTDGLQAAKVERGRRRRRRWCWTPTTAAHPGTRGPPGRRPRRHLALTCMRQGTQRAGDGPATARVPRLTCDVCAIVTGHGLHACVKAVCCRSSNQQLHYLRAAGAPALALLPGRVAAAAGRAAASAAAKRDAASADRPLPFTAAGGFASLLFAGLGAAAWAAAGSGGGVGCCGVTSRSSPCLRASHSRASAVRGAVSGAPEPSTVSWEVTRFRMNDSACGLAEVASVRFSSWERKRQACQRHAEWGMQRAGANAHQWLEGQGHARVPASPPAPAAAAPHRCSRCRCHCCCRC